MALTQEKLAAMRCGTPGCRHSDCMLFLRGQCHPLAALEAAADYPLQDQCALVLRCQECHLIVAAIATARPVHGVLFNAPCHRWGVEAFYTKRSGQLTIRCRTCHAQVSVIEVAKRSKEMAFAAPHN